ncbi:MULTISPECIES: hypothetical protein [unclassified Meridianimarinicoccus]|uniref:hypothetical protein n=1 Tax=unclassified Meridianimarinicoccus TaxID=2923344 RepID=UPI001867893E|nr:hypothetical protein [Fluviibacterium sp. MJW13]
MQTFLGALFLAGACALSACTVTTATAPSPTTTETTAASTVPANNSQYALMVKNRVSWMGLDPTPVNCMEKVDMVELNSIISDGGLFPLEKRNQVKFKLSEAAKKC